MILLIGEHADPVIARLEGLIRQAGVATARVHEDRPSLYTLHPSGRKPGAGRTTWRLTGGDCLGERPVGSVFVRRGPAGTNRQGTKARLQGRLDRLLLGARCPVVNRPSAACGNYPKVHQLIELAEAGLPVPLTLVAAAPTPALQFLAAMQGRVLVKGLSSVRTLPTVVGPGHLDRLDRLSACPAQFQHLQGGTDVRLTTIGSSAIASVAQASGGYRHGDAAELLPRDVVRRCIDFVRAQELVVGGFDLRLQDGRVACFFEMNPNPLITHYETEAEPVLSLRLCKEMLMRRSGCGSILV